MLKACSIGWTMHTPSPEMKRLAQKKTSGKPYIHNQALRRVLDIDGVGEIVALQFRDGLAQRRELVDDLVEQLTIEAEPVQQAGGVFEGMTFCVTGTLSVARKEVQQRIIDAGGKIVGSVSSKLDVLVAGEKAGSNSQRRLPWRSPFGPRMTSLNDCVERLMRNQRMIHPKMRQRATPPRPKHRYETFFPKSAIEHGVGRRRIIAARR